VVGCLFVRIASHFYVKMTNLNIRPNAKYWSLKHSNVVPVTSLANIPASNARHVIVMTM